jgi:hypothetical protein
MKVKPCFFIFVGTIAQRKPLSKLGLKLGRFLNILFLAKTLLMLGDLWNILVIFPKHFRSH